MCLSLGCVSYVVMVVAVMWRVHGVFGVRVCGSAQGCGSGASVCVSAVCVCVCFILNRNQTGTNREKKAIA